MAVPESRVWRHVVEPILEALIFLVVIGGLTWVALRIWVAVLRLVGVLTQ